MFISILFFFGNTLAFNGVVGLQLQIYSVLPNHLPLVYILLSDDCNLSKLRSQFHLSCLPPRGYVQPVKHAPNEG